MKKKKTSIQFGSLFTSFESIMDFIKEMPSLVSIIVSIEFNNSLRWNFISNGFMNEI